MTKENLEKGNELNELIEITAKAIQDIDQIIFDTRKDSDNKSFEDDHYWLCISKHRDGSGAQADLSRYCGNTELLRVIQNTLNKQLDFYKGQLSKL